MEKPITKRVTYWSNIGEMDKILAVVKAKKDDIGLKKYRNPSHFVRCAVIKLLKEEYPTI